MPRRQAYRHHSPPGLRGADSLSARLFEHIVDDYSIYRVYALERADAHEAARDSVITARRPVYFDLSEAAPLHFDDVMR